ncbi:Gfo/Idh/MocA family protein [Paenibacillus eucommiae]|uniref:Dehydrogenase n=1 Tax=Paenibacillus eucommiae TaxID=1355755 RepID=A0ABS4J6Z5_9BACL|nr:Gfo/Idh/MocA family oxidoreductase [Paenibacillus eucommiae]MBP1995615.1 putative dehydrogenase [Paenibacillus eucommiae]
MSTRKFAVIGCQHGHISMFISEMLELGFGCAGIYDKDPDFLARQLCEQFNVPLVSDPEVLLADEAVEIVGSSGINSEKIDVVELCESRGKAVMLDKPAVADRAGFERLQAVIGRGRIQVGMLLTERANPTIYTLQKLIEQGELGEIVSIGMRKPHRLYPATRPGWFFDKAQNGGLIIDLLIHDFDQLRWLTGSEIISSEGYIAKHILPEKPSFYDVTGIQVTMLNRIVAQLYTDWHTPEKSWTGVDGRIFVVGTKGTAELRLSGDPLIGEGSLLLQIGHDEALKSIPLEAVPYTVSEDFLARVDGTAQGVVDHEAILAATKASVEADEAARKI